MRPWWLRCTEWSPAARAGLLGAAALGYLVAFFVLPAEAFAALRPVNVLLVVVAALFFGMRAGVAFAVGVVAVNLGLYGWAGLLAPTGERLGGNLLSIVAGVGLGAVVGRMRDLALALESEVHRRRAAERRRDELSAHLVHDLKNPLTGISGYAQLLEAELDGTPHAEPLKQIHSATERMSRMVMNLLDVGRAEDGALRPALQPVALAPLVEDVHRLLRAHLLEGEIELQVVISPGAPSVHADPELLRRTLLNLLENAIRYTSPRGTVGLEIGGDADEVELVVRDQGPGVPIGHEERIFEKYARLEEPSSMAGDGNRGLGLHFCRVAVAAHGGRIWVEANSPTGSVFRIRLPRRAA